MVRSETRADTLAGAIADVIRHHHTPLSGNVEPHSTDATTFCVQVADRLSVTLIDSADFGDLSDDDCRDRVAMHCLKSEEERRLLTVDRLLAEIEPIRRECQHLMQDLGLHG